MTTDTWSSRDFPVLKAAVQLCEEHGRAPRAMIVEETGLADGEVRKAMEALAAETPELFQVRNHVGNRGFMNFGRPTGHARRLVGQWPTADSVLDALLKQLVETEQDETQTEDTRSRARRVRDALTGGGGAVLTGVLTSVISGQLGG